MTASGIFDDTLRARKGAAWLLLVMIACTAAWLVLNALFVEFQLVSRVVTRPVIHAAILLGLWIALSRAGFERGIRIRIWLVIAITFTLWLAAIWLAFPIGAIGWLTYGRRRPIANT